MCCCIERQWEGEKLYFSPASWHQKKLTINFLGFPPPESGKHLYLWSDFVRLITQNVDLCLFRGANCYSLLPLVWVHKAAV